MKLTIDEMRNIEALASIKSWIELDIYMDCNKKIPYVQNTLKKIESNPITTQSIDELIKQGWRVYPDGTKTPKFKKKLIELGKEQKEVSLFCDGICFRKNKETGEIYNEIGLKKSLEPYERDKTLIHEIVHAHYEFLDDIIQGKNLIEQLRPRWHAVIIEWLTRQLRAKPEILRKTVLGFGLEPYIYDRASLIAFEYQSDQMLLPFMKTEHLEELELLVD